MSKPNVNPTNEGEPTKENSSHNEFDRAVKETLYAITDPYMVRRVGLKPHSIRKLPTEILPGICISTPIPTSIGCKSVK